MTDGNYVAELRSYGMLSTNQAADRIEALTAERDRLRALLAVQPAHVNETPNSEHDARDVLTVATKGGGA